ncbi:retinaldehyde-binding protein 1-like [Chironomus tepperi]|uniref:retinaldehyde-binding protein 1-like n=1 Tax=Chironomus tepperi TaxID=113505 RepID=UPI00391EF9AF
MVKEDIREKQSLELFKKWLEKHPYISYNKNDNIDDLLLSFLRVRNFSMDKAYESFEFTVKFIKSHPEYYENVTKDDFDFMRQPSTPVILMKNRDKEGRAIYIYKAKDFDYSERFVRGTYLVPHLTIYEKETQINGFIAIFDFRDLNFKKFSKIPIHTIHDFFKFSKYCALKPKQINLIGMPSFMKPIYEVGKSFTTAKILDRVNLLGSVDELAKVMDVSILPKEYGGSSNELMEYEAFEAGVEFANLFNKFNVNFRQIQEFEGVGSFRKLEID